MHSIQDSIFPYLLKEYLILIIDFLALTVLALFLTLIAHKLHTEKRSRKKQRLANKYRTMITRCLDSDTSLSERPGSALEYAAFADVCIDLLAKAQDGTKSRIHKLLKESDTVEYFIELAASPSWIKRFYAVEMLGFFMINELWVLFNERIDNEKSPEVRAKAMWSLSLIADRDDLAYLCRKLSAEAVNSSKFNVYVFSNLISSFRKKGLSGHVVRFLGDIKKDETILPVIKRDIIEACGAAALKESSEVINEYFSCYDHDILIRIACIRALGATGGLDAVTTLIGLSDPDWRIRTVTAKAAYNEDDAVISRLQEMLYDSVYTVRINAARKLSELGNRGLSVLKKEAKSKDRFVRETTAFILETINRQELNSKDRFLRDAELFAREAVAKAGISPKDGIAGDNPTLIPAKANKHV